MRSYDDLQTMNGNAVLTPHLCDVGHFSDMDQKRSGSLLSSIDHEENGTESLNR